ncbi:MAG: ribonuclease toxin immunity protein CdiI [Clostridia bacterium]|nr:ribonuclease toxin immunity protein CdiI [Clostridia bacterium]
MHNDFRIPVSEDFYDKHFPIKAFLNAVPDDYFVKVLENLVNGIGFSFNNAHCEFSNDLDSGGDAFTGVRIAVCEDEVVVDYKALYFYLVKACEAYINDYPDSKEAIQLLLNEYKQKYGI